MMVDDLNATLDVGIAALLDEEGQLFDEQGQDFGDGRLRHLDLVSLGVFLDETIEGREKAASRRIRLGIDGLRTQSDLDLDECSVRHLSAVENLCDVLEDERERVFLRNFEETVVHCRAKMTGWIDLTVLMDTAASWKGMSPIAPNRSDVICLECSIGPSSSVDGSQERYASGPLPLSDVECGLDMKHESRHNRKTRAAASVQTENTGSLSCRVFVILNKCDISQT